MFQGLDILSGGIIALVGIFVVIVLFSNFKKN